MKFKYRRYLLYYLARSAAFLVHLVPIKIALRLADLVGAGAFFILGKYRRIAIDNLHSAFGPAKTDTEVRRIAKGVFRNLCRIGVELLHFPSITRENIGKIVRVDGLDRLDKALSAGKGVLLLTGHFGNWELLALTIIVLGYDGSAIGRRIYFYKYDRFLNYLRRTKGVNVIYRDDSPKKILKVLRENKIIGILADQDVDSVDGVFVNFFGRPAHTPVGPVLLARVSGAAIVPAFMVREGSRHTLHIEEPVELADTGDKERDAVENTRRWSEVLESYIRKYPEQWVWIHRRWKTVKR